MYVATSPRLAAAISSNESMPPEEIRYLRFRNDGKSYERAVDSNFLEKFGLPVNDAVVILKDRDKALKQLNDRLLIQKIIREMKGVCPLCLDGVLHPLAP